MLQAGFTEDYAAQVVETLQTAEALNPQDPVTGMLRAEYELTQNNVEGAKTALDAVVKVRPHIPAYDLAIQISLAEGNETEILTVLNNTVAQFPNNPSVLYGVARVLAELEAYADAEVLLQRAIALDANYVDAKYVLAVVKAIGGDEETALELLSELQESNPDNELLIETIRAVEAGEYVAPAVQASSTGEVLPEEETEGGTPDGEVVATPNTVVDNVEPVE